MKLSSSRPLILVLSLLMPWGFGAVQAAEQSTLARRQMPAVDASSTEARVIVKYRSDASVLDSDTKRVLAAGDGSAGPQLASRMGSRLGFTLSDGRSISPRSQVLHASGMSSRVLAEKLAADADVEWAVPDERRYISVAPNDPLYADNQTSATPVAGQWYLRAPTTAVKSAIDVETAWATTQGSSSIVVAVLDTGVTSHPDLTSKLLSGYDFISDTSTANDGGGRDSDPSDPGDWITSTENASGTFKDCDVSNSSWHGTRTASLIGAATNNSVGMAGVAPNVMILPVRVLGKCGGYDSDIQAGMRWAAGLTGTGVATNPNPARVINMSLGASGSCSTAYQSVVTELTAAKVAVVAAAGNDGLAVGVPANCSGVIAVAGVRHTGTKVGYSNLGPQVTVAAPAGNCVNSTGLCLYPIITAGNTGTTSPVAANYSDGTNYSVGTSFAAPLVSGTVALMLSANSALTPGEIITMLKSSATAFPISSDTTVSACQAPSATAQTSECNCTTSTCGAGLLNAGKAVQAVVASDPPTPVISASATLMLAGESITLDASGSTLPSGISVSSYLWEITSGSGTVASFSSGTAASTATLLGKAEGTVTVRLTVTGSNGKSASTSKSFSVAAGKPTASFTASTTTPTAGATVTLTGSGTAQGSAGIASYLWEITSGTTLASLSGSATTASTTLLASAAGTVTVRLTVTDTNGYTGSSNQTITIAAAAGSTSSATSGGSSSGGGGAFSAGWLALVALAAWALARGRRGRSGDEVACAAETE